jgi:hypothetical protein
MAQFVRQVHRPPSAVVKLVLGVGYVLAGIPVRSVVTGVERGNLRRLYRSLPGRYLRQGLRRLAGRRTASTCLWLDEVRGYLEGFSYYWTAL